MHVYSLCYISLNFQYELKRKIPEAFFRRVCLRCISLITSKISNMNTGVLVKGIALPPTSQTCQFLHKQDKGKTISYLLKFAFAPHSTLFHYTHDRNKYFLHIQFYHCMYNGNSLKLSTASPQAQISRATNLF